MSAAELNAAAGVMSLQAYPAFACDLILCTRRKFARCRLCICLSAQARAHHASVCGRTQISSGSSRARVQSASGEGRHGAR